MTNLLQETVQYAYDHWITSLVGLLILLFYRLVVKSQLRVLRINVLAVLRVFVARDMRNLLLP